MIKEFLIKSLNITNPAQLQAALVKLGIKVAVVCVWSILVFVKGCTYGVDKTEDKYYKDIEKATREAAITTGKRAGDAVKIEKDGQRRAARLHSLEEDANEAFNSNDTCYVSDDELRIFNELAEEASR